MSHPVFAVSRFENRNGVISWRVDGRLNGLRIRRNFKTHEEAATENATLDLKALLLESGLRSVPTFLTEEQVREAEAVFSCLKDSSRPLSFCVDYTVANYQEPESQKPLKDAVAAYLATKDHEFEQDHISPNSRWSRLIGFFSLGNQTLPQAGQPHPTPILEASPARFCPALPGNKRSAAQGSRLTPQLSKQPTFHSVV
jgi:hypothetical protein